MPTKEKDFINQYINNDDLYCKLEEYSLIYIFCLYECVYIILSLEDEIYFNDYFTSLSQAHVGASELDISYEH